MGFNTYRVPGGEYDPYGRKRQNNFATVSTDNQGQNNSKFGNTTTGSASRAPDSAYSGMTLREELEARFEDLEAQKQAEQEQANRQKAQIALARRRRWNSWLKYGEYAATSADQGLSLGWADEMEGAARAAGYGLGNAGMRMLNKFGADVHVPDEDWTDAVKRGYVEGRDRRRYILAQGREQVPVLSRSMEYMGATLSPVEFIKVPRLASLHVKTAKRAANAKINGVIYGSGVSEDLKEYPLNIFINIAGNMLGHKGVNKFFGRGANGLGRLIPEEMISNSVDWAKDKAINMYNQW